MERREKNHRSIRDKDPRLQLSYGQEALSRRDTGTPMFSEPGDTVSRFHQAEEQLAESQDTDTDTDTDEFRPAQRPVVKRIHFTPSEGWWERGDERRGTGFCPALKNPVAPYTRRSPEALEEIIHKNLEFFNQFEDDFDDTDLF